MNGKVHGPFSADRLKQLAAAGKISAGDELSRDQLKWTPAANVKGLFPPTPLAMAAPPPSSPTIAAQSARSIGDLIVWALFASVVALAVLAVGLGVSNIIHPLYAIIGGIVLSSACYFLPVIIGAYRGVESIVSLAVVNVFLGWSLVGWVVSLAWACAPVRRTPTPPPISREMNPR
jgi:hypothetical protein